MTDAFPVIPHDLLVRANEAQRQNQVVMAEIRKAQKEGDWVTLGKYGFKRPPEEECGINPDEFWKRHLARIASKRLPSDADVLARFPDAVRVDDETLR